MQSKKILQKTVKKYLFVFKIPVWSFTFGKDWILLASSKSSSKLLEYLRISSGTLTKEQCLLSTNSTCLLQPLNIGIQRNMSQVNLGLALIIIFWTRSYTVAYPNRINLCTLFVKKKHELFCWKFQFTPSLKHYITRHSLQSTTNTTPATNKQKYPSDRLTD